MTSQIAALRENRWALLEQLKGLTPEQFNLIPEGSGNNIIWNLGHMIVVQQGACYNRAGLPTSIPDDFRQRFKPGSKPAGITNADEIVSIQQAMITTLDQLAADYQNNRFGNYAPWVTRYGAELTSIDDALKFVLYHEEWHSAVIMELKGRMVRSMS